MDNQPDSIIKVSLPGKSVHSSDYVNDFMLVAGLPSLHIKRRYKATVTTNPADSGNGTTKIKHGFGYKPQPICFTTTREGTIYPNTYINVPGNWYDFDEIFGEESSQSFDCWVDSEYVYVSAHSSGYAEGWPINYREDTYVFDILLTMEEALTP